MMKLWKYLIFVFMFFAVITGVFIQIVIQHEYLHQLVFQRYGIDSKVTYNFWPATKAQLNIFKINSTTMDIHNVEAFAWTEPDFNSTNDCNETCESLHIDIDIRESQTINIIISIFAVFMLYFLYNNFFKEEVIISINQGVPQESE